MIKIDMWYNDKKEQVPGLISGSMIWVVFILEIFAFSEKS